LQKVVRVDDNLSVKYGTDITYVGDQSKLFISQVIDVRVPMIYVIYSDTQTETAYNVIENTGGRTLV
jgi:hypothetical protein